MISNPRQTAFVCELSDGPFWSDLRTLSRLTGRWTVLPSTGRSKSRRGSHSVRVDLVELVSSDRRREFFRGRSVGVPDLGPSSGEESHRSRQLPPINLVADGLFRGASRRSTPRRRAWGGQRRAWANLKEKCRHSWFVSAFSVSLGELRSEKEYLRGIVDP
jgi:hypothetical protein